MNPTLFPEYKEILEYIEKLQDLVDAKFKVRDIYVNENNEIIFTPEIDLEKSNEQWQDFEFDFGNDFYNGENYILDAIKHQIKKDGLSMVPQLDDIYGAKKYTTFLNEKLIQHFEEQKRKLSETETASIFSKNKEVRERVINAFERLAIGQRGKPEAQMLKVVNLIGGSEFAYLLEHIGDLTHRISQRTYTNDGSIESSLNDILPKIEKSLNILLNRDHIQLMKNGIFTNYEFNSDDPENKEKRMAFFRIVAAELDDYANKHSKLPVFNKFQKLCRDAAVHLGRGNLSECRDCLLEVQKIIREKRFIEEASVWNLNEGAVANKLTLTYSSSNSSGGDEPPRPPPEEVMVIIDEPKKKKTKTRKL